jgi:hypothetical protein
MESGDILAVVELAFDPRYNGIPCTFPLDQGIAPTETGSLVRLPQPS